MSAPQRARGAGRWLAVVGSVVVVASVAAGVVVMGTPGEQRLRRLDARRVEDLRDLSWAINHFHDTRDALPASLSVIESETGRALSLVDPVSGVPYRYQPGKGERYRLCATFTSDSAREPAEDWTPEGWQHGAGEHCFALPMNKSAARALRD